MSNATIGKSLILLSLYGLLLLASVQSYALRSRINLTIYNCIPGKTLYPRIYGSNMSWNPAGNNILKGPPTNSSLGTCGQSARLTHNYEDKGYGNIYTGLHGVFIVTGLNGATLIYQKNNYQGDAPYYPDESTKLPYLGAGWLYGDNGGLGIISNRNYKNLPNNVSCPSGTEAHGPICIGYVNNYNAGYVLRDITYTVYIYPPKGNSSATSLSDMPSL